MLLSTDNLKTINMTKGILFQFFLVMLALSVSAQDIKTVRKLYDKKEWVKGKEAVDLLLANPAEQSNWEAWYFKGLIYGQMAKSPELKSQVPEGWVVSFEAYAKAMELDSKQSTTYMTLRGYPVFDNYLELQKEGNEFFNTQAYKEAIGKYKQADQVGRFIYKNGWALSEVDTILYYYAGAAGMQGNMPEDAVLYYSKIADANIGGEGYDVCYRYLAYHYDKKGNAAQSSKYAAAGRKLYPNDTYYDKLEMDRERNTNGVSPELFAKYEIVIGKEPNNYDLRFDYAAELFNWIYTDQKAPKDQQAAIFEKIILQVKKCMEIDPKKSDSYVLAGKTYYNEAAFIQESGKNLKSTVPDELKKKNELKVQMDKRMNEALPQLEKALEIFEKMTPEEFKAEKRLKNEYKTTLYLLAEAHRFLGNAEKEKFYNKKSDALNQ
jgi:tetratricopeptide (TPR) repeat protein